MKYLLKFNESHYDNDVIKFLYDLDKLDKDLSIESSDSWNMSIDYVFDESKDYILVNFGGHGYSEGFNHTMKIFNYKKMMGELRAEETEGDDGLWVTRIYFSFDDIISEIKTHFGL